MNYFLIKEDELNNNLIESLPHNIKIIKIGKFNRCIFTKILIKLHQILKLPFYEIWFPELKKALDSETTKIINFSQTQIELAKILKKKFPKSKKILWCWDNLKSAQVEFLNKKYDEIWTFDREEALKYNINYHPQFYWNKKSDSKKNDYDLVFIGVDKNRIEMIEKMDKYFSDNNLNSFIYILPDKKKKYNEIYKKYLKEKTLKYEEIRKITENSKSILEINKKGQSGLTLRSLEALFFEKKLITNNKNIEKYSFYNKNNIFIIKDQNLNDKELSEIIDFLKIPYEKVSKEIIFEYSVESWLNKLLNEDKDVS